ncbi:MAG: aspartate 1-decarboxylase [Candidatus Omnitrophota bacterium]
MLRTILKSKIHLATVTQTELTYEGSITVDSAILKVADIYPHEKVEVLNLNNGQRIETYCIEGEAGSGVVCLNGPAARLACVGDKVIILSYVLVDDNQAHKTKSRRVYLDGYNRIVDRKEGR